MDEQLLKQCTQCRQKKPLSAFYFSKGNPFNPCKQCIGDAKKAKKEGTMSDIPQQTIRKGICLMLWRIGRGKIGEKVRLRNTELQESLGLIGIKVTLGIVRSCIVENVKSSWLERRIVTEGDDELVEYKLTQMTGQRAKEAAALLGTEVLAALPKVEEPDLVDEVIKVFGGREVEMIDKKLAADPDAEFLDRMLTLLTTASDAKRLQTRVAELEAQAQKAQLPSHVTHAIAIAYAILSCLSMLDKQPLGMLVNAEFKDRSVPLTLEAAQVAEVLREHFKEA